MKTKENTTENDNLAFYLLFIWKLITCTIPPINLTEINRSKVYSVSGWNDSKNCRNQEFDQFINSHVTYWTYILL